MSDGFVILNNIDCPEPRMIALVSLVCKGVVYGNYISSENWHNTPVEIRSEVTKVTDFGIDLSPLLVQILFVESLIVKVLRNIEMVFQEHGNQTKHQHRLNRQCLKR